MPRRASEEEIQAFLDEMSDLMRDLADSLICPSCKNVVRGDKFNLGEKFHWTEGCEDCASDPQG